MEQTRGQERKGHPGKPASEGKSANQPPTSFEGMNYEQRREPYRGHQQRGESINRSGQDFNNEDRLEQ